MYTSSKIWVFSYFFIWSFFYEANIVQKRPRASSHLKLSMQKIYSYCKPNFFACDKISRGSQKPGGREYFPPRISTWLMDVISTRVKWPRFLDREIYGREPVEPLWRKKVVANRKLVYNIGKFRLSEKTGRKNTKKMLKYNNLFTKNEEYKIIIKFTLSIKEHYLSLSQKYQIWYKWNIRVLDIFYMQQN